MEILLLECQQSSLKSRNEKPLIWRSIGSFQVLSQVRLCVFILISFPITLGFIFESYIRLILYLNSVFSLSSRSEILPNFCSLISPRILIQID